VLLITGFCQRLSNSTTVRDVSRIVVTASMGQTTVALIIALFAGAFFSRAAC
jgi:hypothetical protein